MKNTKQPETWDWKSALYAHFALPTTAIIEGVLLRLKKFVEEVAAYERAEGAKE